MDFETQIEILKASDNMIYFLPDHSLSNNKILPTPNPRRKCLLNDFRVPSDLKPLVSNNSLNGYEETANTNSLTEIELCNDTIETFLNETNEKYNSNFISSTMPLPRKPRQTLPRNKSKLKSQPNEEYTIKENLNTDYLNGSSDFSNSLNKILLNEINERDHFNFDCQSTFKFNRSIKLERPSAPPPPPPPLILGFNNNYTSKVHHSLSNDHLLKIIDSPRLKATSHIYTSTPNRFKSNPNTNTDNPNLIPIGFKYFTNLKSNSNASSLKHELNNVIKNNQNLLIKSKSNLVSHLVVILLFVSCIGFIISFQKQVHVFYKKFLEQSNKSLNDSNSLTNNSGNQTDEYLLAGSNLVRQTVLFCNGPYFTYQINNLMVLPFSLVLVIVFSFYKEQEHCVIKNKKSKCLRKPGFPATINPFQRRNRFFVAALFCIIANEIFKMIESSMFSNENKSNFNSTSELLNSILNFENKLDPTASFNSKSHSNTDFLRIGLGIEPDFTRLTLTKKTTTKPTTLEPNLIMAPSVLRYSKPKLPPRLNYYDFETTKTSNTLNEFDQNLTLTVLNTIHAARHYKNKTIDIINSFNRTLNGSSSKTLFEISIGVFQNDYMQKAIQKIFKTQGFRWSIIFDSLEKIAIMLVEVFVIGMRYYPILGVMEKDSIICLILASLYMWADVFYNVAITGLCEGLKLNLSIDLLKNLRRIFSAGFLMDYIQDTNTFKMSDSNIEQEISTNLLFSTSRILYTTMKSLPHFMSLSYVTVRLSMTVIKRLNIKFSQFSVRLKNRCKINEKTDLIVDTKTKIQNKVINFIYVKKYSIDAEESYSDDEKYGQCRQISLSFEDKYVKHLFENTSKVIPKEKCDSIILFLVNFFIEKLQKLKNNSSFRFSTRIVCTYTVCLTVLYYLTCFLAFYGSIFIDLIFLPNTYKYSISFSAFGTSIYCLFQLVLSLRQIKLHLKSLYRGKADQYITPKHYFSNKKIAKNNFNYAGYVVTYTCWGYFLLFLLTTFISFQFTTLFYFGNSTYIGVFLIVIFLPFLISLLIIKSINRFLTSMAAKFCFLQKKSKVLALKNFKLYSLFLYFKFFYDCFTGIAYCLIRMLKSILLAIFFMTRLDYSFMGRNMERMDSAFMSYIGYLYWESHHTNSIMISFCELLKRSNKLNKEQMRKNRIINRWQLLYLIYKNQSLKKYRKF